MRGKLINYWIDSAGLPSLVMNWLKKGSALDISSFREPVLIPLLFLSATQDMARHQGYDDALLLFQAGYLTIKEIYEKTAVLGYPNNEVEGSFAELYCIELLGSKNSDPFLTIRIKSLFEQGESAAAEIFSAFNRFFLAIPYDQSPITTESLARMAILLLCEWRGMYVIAEHHNSKGRSDLEAVSGSVQWVFELKYSEDGKDADSKLEEAVEQIQSREYGNPPLAGQTVKMAMVFDGTQRKLTKWQLVR